MTRPSKKIKLKVRINKGKRRKSVDERTIDGSEFIEHFDEKVEHYVDDYVDRVTRTKQLTLISGVGFFMLLILSFYAYNFKFQVTSLVSGDEGDIGISTQINSIKENVGEIVNNYKDIKQVISTGIEEANTASTTGEEVIENNNIPETPIVNDDVSIETLKKKLLEDIKE